MLLLDESELVSLHCGPFLFCSVCVGHVSEPGLKLTEADTQVFPPLSGGSAARPGDKREPRLCHTSAALYFVLVAPLSSVYPPKFFIWRHRPGRALAGARSARAGVVGRRPAAAQPP